MPAPTAESHAPPAADTARTTLETARAEADSARAQLQRANDELGALADTLAHDLRAPIRHIDGFVQMLEELEAQTLSPEGRRLLRRFRASADRLGNLIDDVVRLARLGRGGVRRGTIDTDAAVRSVAADLLGSPDTAAVFHFAPLPPADADATLFRLLWETLIGNALKFSSPRQPAAGGTPTLRVGVSVTQSRTPRITIDARRDGARTWYRVADNGVGFDPRYAHKLFTIFQRLHRAEDFPGAGVGLAIARKIVALHGGDIRARATPNQGATFEFTLGP